jgi:hypothetical protein
MPKSISLEFLHEMRKHTDPVADKVIQAVIHSDTLSINEVFNSITKNNDVNIDKLPDVVKDYFNENRVMPDFATGPGHDKMMHIGQDVFRRFGLQSSMLLFFLSLPTSYACWRGAKVLMTTGRMYSSDREELDRLQYRLMETAQFVINVMQRGAFDDKADGIVTALKVRLTHSAIRHYIKDYGGWDVEKYGEPINQMDLAGTLMSFSAMVLNGLKQMGVKLKPFEEEAYYHCWRVTGHFMGVDIRLVPERSADGLALGFQIMDDQKGQSEDGDKLVNSLIDLAQKIMPGHFLSKYVPVYLINYFVGENLGDSLTFKDVPRFWNRLFKFFFRKLSGFMEALRVPRYFLIERRIGKMKQPFLNKMCEHLNDHKKVTFYIPPSLQEDWEKTADGHILTPEPYPEPYPES